MADAGERCSDQAQQEKGKRVKGAMTAERAATILASAKASGVSPTAAVVEDSKAISVRTQLSIARFGKAARHPLCQAALALWSQDAERSKVIEKAVEWKMWLNRAEQQKKQAKELLDHFYEQGKQKEAIEAAELLRKINEDLPTIQKAYSASVEFLAVLEEARILAAWQFNQELLAAKLTKNTSALKALSRVQKRWKALSNGARLKYGEQREIGTLQLLQDKKIKAEWAKGGALAGYTEAMDGGDRPLSDDEWQGRLTAREIHSHIEATVGSRVAGDKDAKEIKRVAKRLGLRLVEGQVGRKWKTPTPLKQKPKKPVGRPRKAKLITVGDDKTADGDAITSDDKLDFLNIAADKGKTAIPYIKWSWQPTAEFEQKEAAIARELAKLRRARKKAR